MYKETLPHIIEQDYSKRSLFKLSPNSKSIETIYAFENTKGKQVIKGVSADKSATGSGYHWLRGYISTYLTKYFDFEENSGKLKPKGSNKDAYWQITDNNHE